MDWAVTIFSAILSTHEMLSLHTNPETCTNTKKEGWLLAPILQMGKLGKLGQGHTATLKTSSALLVLSPWTLGLGQGGWGSGSLLRALPPSGQSMLSQLI